LDSHNGGGQRITSQREVVLVKSEISRTFVDKPWGGEDWLVKTEHYVAKHLFVNPKEELSLQYHNDKHETMIVLEGMGSLLKGSNGGAETEAEQGFHRFWATITVGDIITLPPKTIHQIRAISHLKILEISTPQTEDLVRLGDKYGR
jgi:mannose-6-phosphate isomerase